MSLFDKAKDMAGDAMDKAGDVAGSAKDAAGGAAGAAGGAASSLKDKALDGAEAIASKTPGSVDDKIVDKLKGDK